MSKVFSFRLREDKPRERKALEILLDNRQKGFSMRHILTDALILYESKNILEIANEKNRILSRTLEGLLGQIPGPLSVEKTIGKNNLTSGLFEGIKKSAKPGIKL